MTDVKVRRLVVGKGLTHRPTPSEEAWTKTYFEVEAEIAEGQDINVVKDDLLAIVEKWLSDVEIGEKVLAMPKLDIVEIEKLPWKNLNREPAKPNEFAWILGPESKSGTEPGAEELVKAIKACKNGKFTLGNYEYSLSKDSVFIQRRFLKQDEKET